MNAILLAGDRKATYPLHGINKAFLPLEGHPLFIYVLAALDLASRIERVYVIGPRKQIMEAIEKALPAFFFSKKIEVLEQKECLIENIFHAYRYAVGGPTTNGTPISGLPPALFLPADIPLVTAQEIDSFISKADTDRFDYCLGVTPAEHLKQFYPKSTEPGIKMPYLYLKDQIYRINNLHIGRLSSPSAGSSMLQTMYNYRYQKNVWNRVWMGVALLKANRATHVLFLYFLAQAAVLLSRFGFHRLAAIFRQPLELSYVEREVSALLGIRFKAIETNEGGAALDIDDVATYKTISSVFSKWRATLSPPRAMVSCPFETKCHEIAP